jgi:U4/U6.U5 tri-snRNP-associated protein 3
VGAGTASGIETVITRGQPNVRCFAPCIGHPQANVRCAAGNTRKRSRSPPARASSPPRGARAGERERDRGKDGGERDRGYKGAKANGVAPPPAKPSTGRKGGPNGDAATDKDTVMVNVAMDETDEDALLRRTMGFVAFNTTKNKKIPGNDKNYAVRKDKKTKYRQYMNRQGGFNRPLSPS